jgi:hypothetical protein
VAVLAAGLIGGYVAAARRRPSTLPARLIFGGIGLALLGGAVLGLAEALAQRNLLGVLAMAALTAPGVIFLRVGSTLARLRRLRREFEPSDST